MSMRTDIVYGYGFEICCTDKQLINFIKKHKEVVECLYRGRDLLQYISKGKTDIKEKFNSLECELTGHEGAYSVISNVISRETGIRFQYECGDADCCSTDTIMFCPIYPWQCNEAEKALTEKKLEEIVNKYVDELGIIATTGYLQVEYYG